MFSRTARWLAMAALGVLALLVLALGAGLVLIRTDAAASFVAERASAALGREVGVGGLAVPLHLPPSIIARDVHIANADWAQKPRMAEVAELAASVDLTALVGGQLVLRRIRIVEPRLLLQRSPQGTGNWASLTRGPAGRLPVVRHVTLTDGDVVLREMGGVAEIRASVGSGEGAIIGSERRLQFRAAGTLEQSPFRVRLRQRSGAPGFEAELDVERLDLRPLFRGGETAADAATGKLLPTTQIRLGPLRTLRGTVRLASRTVQLPGIALGQLEGRLDLQPDRVAVRDFGFDLAGGRVRAGLLELVPIGRQFEATLDLRVIELALRELLKRLELQAVQGFGDLQGRIHLTGTGASPAELFGSADGTVELIMREGRLDRLLVRLAGQNVGSILRALGAEEGETVPLRCLIADFGVSSGIMKAQTLILDTAHTKIVGNGRVDLQNETVALHFLPRDKDFSLISSQAPMRLSGGFRNLSLGVDTGAAVASLLTPMELGVAENADCDALAKAARRN